MASRGVQIALLVLTSILMLITFAMNFLSFSPLGRTLGIFSNTSDTVWNNRNNLTQSLLNPPEYAFGVWGFIYIYQVAMLLYCWTLPFRRTKDGDSWLCSVPGLLPVGFLICHSLSSVLNSGFVLVADRTDRNWTLLALVFIMLCLAISLTTGIAISIQQLAVNKQLLQQEGLSAHYWLVIGLQQNGCGVYVGWAWIASFINIDNAIINLADYPAMGSSLLCFCQLYGILAAYVLADLSFLDPYVRFFFGPYLTLLWGLATSVAAKYVAASAASIVGAELAALLAAVLIAKAAAGAVRQRRCPLLPAGQWEGSRKKTS